MYKISVKNGKVAGLFKEGFSADIPEDAIAITDETAELIKSNDFNDLMWDGTNVIVTDNSVERVVPHHIKAIKDSFVAEHSDGFVSSALGAPHRYSSDPIALIHLVGAVALEEPRRYWCTDLKSGIHAKRQHNSAQIKKVLQDAAAFADKLVDKLHERVDAVTRSHTVDDVKKVKW